MLNNVDIKWWSSKENTNHINNNNDAQMYEKEEQLELWQHLWSAYYTSGANLHASHYELIFATILLGFFH